MARGPARTRIPKALRSGVVVPTIEVLVFMMIVAAIVTAIMNRKSE
jgi:hypothetical protein